MPPKCLQPTLLLASTLRRKPLDAEVFVMSVARNLPRPAGVPCALVLICGFVDCTQQARKKYEKQDRMSARASTFSFAVLPYTWLDTTAAATERNRSAWVSKHVQPAEKRPDTRGHPDRNKKRGGGLYAHLLDLSQSDSPGVDTLLMQRTSWPSASIARTLAVSLSIDRYRDKNNDIVTKRMIP